MNPVSKMFSRIAFLLSFSLIRSFWYGVRVFGFRKGVKLPLLMGPRARIILGKTGRVTTPDTMKLGMIRIGHDCTLTIDGELVLKGRTVFTHSCGLYIAPTGTVEIGDLFSVNEGLSLNCHKRITFGDEVMISWKFTIMDSDGHRIYDEFDNQINQDADIRIGNQVWISNSVMVLKGIAIADGIVVGAGAVVSKSLPQERSIYVGNPARRVRENITWKS